jgi:hypothetical protein
MVAASTEMSYDALLAARGPQAVPGDRGTATYAVEDQEFTISWELRPNAVWRHGRLFLRCPCCRRRCTRLYLPLSSSWLACRRCWGLSYESRGLSNYHDSLWGRGMLARALATTQREWAYRATYESRALRRQRSRERWAARRDSASAQAGR